MNDIILLCFTGHILGDYYLQSEKDADNKNEKFVRLVCHTIIYSLPFAVIFLIFGRPLKLGFILLSVCLLHFLIDFAKFIFYKSGLFRILVKKCKIKEWQIYLADQALHIILILTVLYTFKFPTVIHRIHAITHFEKVSGINTAIVLKWVLLILCIYKPSNITFIKLFSNYKPEIAENLAELKAAAVKIGRKAGAIIGFLERILIVYFMSIEQYSAIGLILTAKSIARYDKITKDQDFAEYYLIGTLASVLFALGFYKAIFLA